MTFGAQSPAGGLARLQSESYNGNVVSEESPLESAPQEWGASAPPGAGRRLLRMLGELLQTLLIAGLLFLVINQITARIRVEGNSMEPNLHDGEFVVVNRLAYIRKEPERGDIIVFHSPRDPDKRFIKRVIGLPGDVVVLQDSDVLINGVLLEEPYLEEVPQYTSRQWTVGADEVFVLGDNREDSRDSRSWGNLLQEEIIGKAILVYWPLSDVGTIPHYDLSVASPE